MQRLCWFCGRHSELQPGGRTGCGIPSMVYSSLAFFTIPELDDDAAFAHEQHDCAAICATCLQGLHIRCQPPSEAYLTAMAELETRTSDETLSVDTQLYSFEDRELLWYDWFRELPHREIREWFAGLSIGELFERGLRFANPVPLRPERLEKFLDRLENAGNFGSRGPVSSTEFREHINSIFGPQPADSHLRLWHTRVQISDYSVIKYVS